MKRSVFFLVAIVAFGVFAVGVVSCRGRSEGGSSGSSTTGTPGAPKVEIAFLNHSPVISALTEVDKLLASYGDKITVIRYDLDTAQGADFIKSKGLVGHAPLAIFVNGSMEIKLNDRTVKFYSFPQGTGVGAMVASGTWTVEDLRQAIDQALGSAK